MTHITLHRLGPDDHALLLRLNAMFAVAFDDADTYEGAPPDEAWARETLGRPNVIALAARDGGAVVGGLVAYELDKLESRRREVYLYDLAVADTHRRQGIATRLIDHLRAIARERGAWVVYVQADYGDEPAIALYTKLGVREDVMHFDLPLDGVA
ncbi:AAC(3)-I family aminoglycoside N-acetyltransferase [uncultured Hydrogenophaga sp.]|uniref:AAC(3)-I family aminoglycoside N-acetyltransferase n=1 Tax=uncultured Hydrogenophaga sp. TaxID=199683 RepID=UPI0025888EEC|nr:AAC(3)-I family aminoglycoside N-acetyltransferase [uncultured Hydrogenophaga sp.]